MPENKAAAPNETAPAHGTATSGTATRTGIVQQSSQQRSRI